MRTLEDPATRARMGQNAREAVLPLTADAMTLQLVLLYKELLEASARQQKTDFARKLKAHRDAWAAKAGLATAGTTPGVPADAVSSNVGANDAHAGTPAGPKPAGTKPAD
jgi:hypothetical protein